MASGISFGDGHHLLMVSIKPLIDGGRKTGQ
jgi:hypothetical protein